MRYVFYFMTMVDALVLANAPGFFICLFIFDWVALQTSLFFFCLHYFYFIIFNLTRRLIHINFQKTLRRSPAIMKTFS